jgi:hypothetical protein
MAGPNHTNPHTHASHSVRSEAIAGVVAIVLWFALFVGGTNIGTKPDREILAGNVPSTIGEKVGAAITVLFCYTATNIAMLCCTAAALGGLLRRYRQTDRHPDRPLQPASLFVLMLTFVLQGFIIYLVMVAGAISFVGWGQFVESPTQDQYIRLAAAASLVSLMIGYSPGLFNNLIKRLEKWTAEKTTPEQTCTLPTCPLKQQQQQS